MRGTPPGSSTTTATRPERPRRLPTGAALAVAVLLLIPLVALALVPVYSSTTPTLWGFPFFYWYQILWVLITPVLTYTAYLIIKRVRGE